MAKQKRVFEVAKELGVASKAIVAKCEAEGVPGITNHMSTVKIGLIATLHEWFGEGAEEEGAVATATAIETADKVDLTKARKGARKRATKKSAASEGKEGDATPVAKKAAKKKEPAASETTEADAGDSSSDKGSVASDTVTDVDADTSAEAVAAKDDQAAAAKTKKSKKTTKASLVKEDDAADTTTEGSGSDSASASDSLVQGETQDAESNESAAPTKQVAMGRPNVPDRPDVVSPVGQLLNKPSEVKLKGPKLIRQEAPDVINAPKPRQRPGGGGQGGGGGGDNFNVADGSVEGITRSRGPKRGGGAGAGSAMGPGDAAKQKKNRRSLSPRSGRHADSLGGGKKTFSEADYQEQQRRINQSRGFVKQRRQQASKGGGQIASNPVDVGGKVVIREPITIKGLSAGTGIKAADIIKYLFAKGVMATINSAIDSEAAMEVALEYDIELEVTEQETAEQALVKEFEVREDIDVRPRPPVVTVLGHVDHGKTSLLDRIRKADVASHEAGGITQHVGAYRVTVVGNDNEEKTVVFLDTPGHEAFTSMRARGAQMTDIIVLLVAADDGVMPQTIESINHAKAAEVPIVVALNKIDRPEANEDNIRKIYGQLAEHGLNPVEWGGETEVMKVSATEGIGITELLEVLDYQAELLELTADHGGPARGMVIEAEMQEGRGPVARVLVQSGHLKVGDSIVIGRSCGRVRDMTDHTGKALVDVGPATPVEISGIDRVPDAGDHLYATATPQKAQQVAEQFRDAERQKQLAQKTKISLETFADQINTTEVRELRVVLKGDVQGSIETIRQKLEEMGNDEVTIKVIHSAVGGITENDINLADASDAIIVGFHVAAPTAVRDIADERQVEIRTYRIIYELLDEVKAALEGMLTPDRSEEILGAAECKEVFRISKLGVVAGCIVAEGLVRNDSKMRVERDGVIVADNRDVLSLRRVKDDAKEVKVGTECGIRLKGFDDVKPGDRLVAYRVIETARKLD